MKVKELIEQLKGYDGETLVVMMSDGEGNSVSPLADICLGKYKAESTWSGEFTDIPEDMDDMEDAVDAIGLWPTN